MCVFSAILMFVLLVQKQQWVKLQADRCESRQWPPTVLEITPLLTNMIQKAHFT